METRPLKICLVAATLQTGGAERVVCDILEGLYKAGHEPYLFCTDGPGNMFDDATAIARQATTRRHTPWVIDFSVADALSKFVRQHRVDVIHAHNQPAQLYGAVAAIRTGRPLVVTIHGQGFGEPARAVRLRRCLTRFSTRLIAVSRDARQSMVDKCIASPDRILVVGNGVDLNKFSATAGTDHADALPKDAFVIGTVGRLSPEKNYPMLVHAFARLLKDSPDRYFLLIVGDGTDRQRIEREIAACEIRNSSLITGIEKDVTSWLRRMHIFCLSSNTEGMPITLLEAGACGLPSVLTDVGGIREVVENSVTGLLVPAGDEAGFADALRKLAGNEDLRRQMGAAARKRTEALYSMGAMIRRHIKIYRDVLRA